MKTVEIINGKVVLNDGLCPVVLEPKEEKLTYDEAIDKYCDRMANISQLLFIYNNLKEVNEALQEVEGDPINKNGYYLCKEQYSATNAWNVNMRNGNVNYDTRTYTDRVRAVSAFKELRINNHNN